MIAPQTFPRERSLESWLAKHFPLAGRREIQIDASLEKLDARTILRAIRRAGKSGVVDLGPGEFSSFELDRPAELISREGGLTSIRGCVKVTAGPSILRGVTLRAAGDAPALIVNADFLLEDCDVYGAIEVTGGCSFYIHNCRIVANSQAVSLSAKSKLEASASRFSGIPAGLLVEAQAECALFGCRVEGCSKGAFRDQESAAGIFCSGRLFLEGCEIFRNDVGVYLKSAEEFVTVATHFQDNLQTGVFAEDKVASEIIIKGSLLESPIESGCELSHFAGGPVALQDCRLRSGTTPPVFASKAILRMENCVVESQRSACVEIEEGQLAMQGSRCESQQGPGLRTWHTTGTISGGMIRGKPPIEQVNSNQLKVEGVVLLKPDAPPTPSPSVSSRPGTIEAYLDRLDEIVGQETAKKEMRRLLRLAYAARERRSQGLNPGDERFSGILTGPPGCGKFSAAVTFASILHEMGELRSPEVLEMDLSDAVVADPRNLKCGIVFIRTSASQGLTLRSPGIAEALLRLVRSLDGAAHVLLDGERDLLCAFVRSRPELTREFPTEFQFSAFSPTELAELFARHCQSEKIPLSPAAARKLTVILHSLHDRLQRRYTDLEGGAGLFAEARRNYLDRCAREGRFDLPMEPSDISAPLDRATASTLERFVEIVAVCPHCQAENPWLPGLPEDRRCLSCGQSFRIRWGYVRNSTYYRRRKSKVEALRSGGVARRRQVAANLPS